MTNGPDYHALDRLYALESEERQERRGLETRASASIAASLAALAFSVNAVSDDLTRAGTLPVVLLATGAGLILAGVLLNTLALLGGSRTTIRWGRSAARGIGEVNKVLLPLGVGISLDPRADRARSEFDDVQRTLRLRSQDLPPGQAATLRRAGHRRPSSPQGLGYGYPIHRVQSAPER